MKLVIEIPDKAYDFVRSKTAGGNAPNFDAYDMYEISRCIANGKPLPKGHNRLLILDEGLVEQNMFPLSFSCQKWISEVGISNSVVTIIEADKAESGDK